MAGGSGASPPMDLVRAFAAAGLTKGVSIHIQGTAEEPLFQANQVGELLGIANVRDSIKDFDDDETRVGTTDTSAGPRQATFLTELGLYRLLGQSRKPIARPFQKWVATVVKEIRLKGRYDLEEQRALLTREKEQAQLALEAKDAELAAKDAELAAKYAELERIKTKTYEEVPKLDNVYIHKSAAELASDAHKVGKALSDKKREAQLNTALAQGGKMIYVRPTHNAKIVEDIAKVALRRYHIASLGGVEHYNNRVEHSVDVIDIAATVVDTLASSFEYITREDLFNRVFDNLNSVAGNQWAPSTDEDEDDDEDPTELPPAMRDWRGELANAQNPLAAWLEERYELTEDRAQDKVQFTKEMGNAPGVPNAAPGFTFLKHVSAYFTALGRWRKDTKIRADDGRWVTTNNVAIGVRARNLFVE